MHDIDEVELKKIDPPPIAAHVWVKEIYGGRTWLRADAICSISECTPETREAYRTQIRAERKRKQQWEEEDDDGGEE